MKNYLTCRIGREWYGIPIEHVIEVLHLVALNEVPSEKVAGVMTLREQVIPVIDLRGIFNISEPIYELDTPIIAVQYQNHKLGMIVDEADDVMPIVTDHQSPHEGDGIDSIARIGDRLVFILDLSYVVNVLQV